MAAPTPSPPAAGLAAAGCASAPDGAGAAGGAGCPWYIYKRPDISLEHVHTVAVYAVPAGQPVYAQWKERLVPILTSCRAFHHAQFPGSRLTWALHGPLVFPFEADKHRDAPDKFYQDVMLLLGHVLSRSPWFPLAAARNELDEASPPATSVPTHVTFTVFADWGQELAWENNNLHKYYVYRSAVDKDALRDIRLTGGSRAAFFGTTTASELAGLRCWPRGCAAKAKVGWGLGVVTQEAWCHPEVGVLLRLGESDSSPLLFSAHDVRCAARLSFNALA